MPNATSLQVSAEEGLQILEALKGRLAGLKQDPSTLTPEDLAREQVSTTPHISTHVCAALG